MSFKSLVMSAKKVGIIITVSNGKWCLRYADTLGTGYRLTRLSDVRGVVIAEFNAQLAEF